MAQSAITSNTINRISIVPGPEGFFTIRAAFPANTCHDDPDAALTIENCIVNLEGTIITPHFVRDHNDQLRRLNATVDAIMERVKQLEVDEKAALRSRATVLLRWQESLTNDPGLGILGDPELEKLRQDTIKQRKKCERQPSNQDTATMDFTEPNGEAQQWVTNLVIAALDANEFRNQTSRSLVEALMVGAMKLVAVPVQPACPKPA